MQKITNTSVPKANLCRLIKIVRETNEPIIIGKAGQPIAILSAYKQSTAPRKLGGRWKGKVQMAEDFNEPNEALNDSFFNGSIFPDGLQRNKL